MNRSGIALIYALFALLIVEAMTTGLCALALHARAAAGARARLIQSHAHDEYILTSALNSIERLSLDSITIGSARSSGELKTERLSEGEFLLTSGSSAAIARYLDRLRFIEDAFGVAPSDSSIAIGGVRWDEIASILDQDSTAVYAASNTVITNDGSGLLVVDGSLELRGAHFTGVVVARRGLSLTNGASITGGVLSNGLAFVPGTPGFAFSANDIVRVVTETPSALRQILAQRRYVPTFQ